ncbi:MAG: DEAD/DEAH box helicase [Planctomycetota bacterium]
MSMRVDVVWPWDSRIRLENGGIAYEQALRQKLTAQSILERLAIQPGVVLADEVGMGKTFVALAVAACAAKASLRPVVVMVPPRLLDKWESDARRFGELCLEDRDEKERAFRVRRAESGAELLKCFDDRAMKSTQLVLLSNTALHRSERDPFVRLAAMQAAMNRGRFLRAEKRSVARHARSLLRSSSLSGMDEQSLERLLVEPCANWKAVLGDLGVPVGEDPVPGAFIAALESQDLGMLRDALRAVPQRDSRWFEERLVSARTALGEALRSLWKEALKRARIYSPLLIFDEAHHLKNPDTRLGGLFLDPETGDTSVISDAFDRMLFLTATPFQLGHRELLEVLRRFLSARWIAMPKSRSIATVKSELERLGEVLDRAQAEALELDRAWGGLSMEALGFPPRSELPPGWWKESKNLQLRRKGPQVCGDETASSSSEKSGAIPAAMARALEQYDATFKVMRAAERALRPWVIRHLRPRDLVGPESVVARRQELRGRSIDGISDGDRGIEIDPQSRVPFLLCARAQSLMATEPGRRAYFAEGLSSSYEAFLHTREGSNDALPVDDTDTEVTGDTDSGMLDWYLSSVREFVRADAVHPKVEATAQRVVDLWAKGEKVLVFGHFRMTIRALRKRIQQLVDRSISQLAAKKLQLPPSAAGEARDRVRRIVQRLQDKDSPLRRLVRAGMETWLVEVRNLTVDQKRAVLDLLLRTLATPSFVVRRFPLDRAEVRESLEAERPRGGQARAAAEAVAAALLHSEDDRLSFRSRVDAFITHVTRTLSTNEDRDQLLSELGKSGLEVVRHASGEVREEQRRRILLGFNSPMLPEILVASEVMAEGLDLHLDCRHVIHHDLSWNPSTLEQRTGRIDRLGCLAERERKSIQIYLPYLEGTADEKMYRVVMDRARWFQVVMGEKYPVDEYSTDKLVERVPFPTEAAVDLAFDLAVAKEESGVAPSSVGPIKGV